MPTERSATLFEFAPVEGRRVVAAFDGGAITSNAGALLLGATDRAINLISRFAACFRDARSAERIEHKVATLVGQRIFGIALGQAIATDPAPQGVTTETRTIVPVAATRETVTVTTTTTAH